MNLGEAGSMGVPGNGFKDSRILLFSCTLSHMWLNSRLDVARFQWNKPFIYNIMKQ